MLKPLPSCYNVHFKVATHEGTSRRDLLQRLVPCSDGTSCGDKSLEGFRCRDLLVAKFRVLLLKFTEM